MDRRRLHAGSIFRRANAMLHQTQRRRNDPTVSLGVKEGFGRITVPVVLDLHRGFSTTPLDQSRPI